MISNKQIGSQHKRKGSSDSIITSNIKAYLFNKSSGESSAHPSTQPNYVKDDKPFTSNDLALENRTLRDELGKSKATVSELNQLIFDQKLQVKQSAYTEQKLEELKLELKRTKARSAECTIN
jgi:hypothetical protein